MLTRLHVRGFKNLLDVDVLFGPFTCLAGPNGVGKSNLFDAIHFLHLLSKHPILEAVQQLRESKGRSPDARSLFTAYGDFLAPEIRFVADLIVDREVEDDFRVRAEAAISTLRYEVAFRLNTAEGPERLELAEESLRPINLTRARRQITFPKSKGFLDSVVQGRRTRDFISTDSRGGEPTVTVHQEGHGGRRLPAPRSTRTVLGGMASSDYPSILAAQREMASWRTLLLEPSAMRAASLYRDPREIDARGGNLPAVIYRLERDERQREMVTTELANRLADLIDDVKSLRVRDDAQSETFTLEVQGRDGVYHPARSLSDGTLRFLVLATLALDPQAKGVICLEEPENGIHPRRVPAMVRLLKDIAVDPQHAVGAENPLRQVVVNTHSPEVFQNVAPTEDLIFFEDAHVSADGVAGRVASVCLPVNSWRQRLQEGHRTLTGGQIQDYLGFAAPDDNRQLWLTIASSGS